MALKTFIQFSLLSSVALTGSFAVDAAEPANDDDRIVEEVVVSAKGWRKSPEPQPRPEPTQRQIDDDIRQKLSRRIQLGYDPVLADIRNTNLRIKVRGNMLEPLPSTVVRIGF